MKNLVLVSLVILLVYLQGRLWFGDNSVAEIRSLQSRISQLEAQNNVQQQVNDQLRAQVRAMKDQTEQDALIEQARERLGLIAPGETLYLFVDEQQ
ncbi:septum formation initiator family protein [Salinispirillum sp. LH 10-3-1]|uniref:Cell division protein FtsB n=1 Tax=Salinispirillum sp. LH 10-3-1 TaxID=2952525 RepID=A0AB38YIJ2_9GAMM